MNIGYENIFLELHDVSFFRDIDQEVLYFDLGDALLIGSVKFESFEFEMSKEHMTSSVYDVKNVQSHSYAFFDVSLSCDVLESLYIPSILCKPTLVCW